MLEVIKRPGPKQVDDQMGPVTSYPFARGKEVLGGFGLRDLRALTMIFLLGGA
jgi:hypothetical protein